MRSIVPLVTCKWLQTFVMYARARTSRMNSAHIASLQPWWFVLQTVTGPTRLPTSASKLTGPSLVEKPFFMKLGWMSPPVQ